MRLSVKTAGVTLGLLFGLLHAAGVLLRALAGKPLVDWALSIHQMQMTYALLPFDIATFVVGTLVAVVLGAVIGALFAVIWNAVEKPDGK